MLVLILTFLRICDIIKMECFYSYLKLERGDFL